MWVSACVFSDVPCPWGLALSLLGTSGFFLPRGSRVAVAACWAHNPDGVDLLLQVLCSSCVFPTPSAYFSLCFRNCVPFSFSLVGCYLFLSVSGAYPFSPLFICLYDSFIYSYFIFIEILHLSSCFFGVIREFSLLPSFQGRPGCFLGRGVRGGLSAGIVRPQPPPASLPSGPPAVGLFFGVVRWGSVGSLPVVREQFFHETNFFPPHLCCLFQSTRVVCEASGCSARTAPDGHSCCAPHSPCFTDLGFDPLQCDVCQQWVSTIRATPFPSRSKLPALESLRAAWTRARKAAHREAVPQFGRTPL